MSKRYAFDPQSGYRPVTVRNMSAVGCPKLATYWFPITEWTHNGPALGRRALEACSSLTGVHQESLYLEVNP